MQTNRESFKNKLYCSFARPSTLRTAHFHSVGRLNFDLTFMDCIYCGRVKNLQRSCFRHSRFLLIRFLVFRQEWSQSRFSHKSSKAKRLKRMKISSSFSWDSFLDANICSNGGLIILKLMLKLLMRRSPMHHYPMRSLNYTFWAGKLIFNHH